MVVLKRFFHVEKPPSSAVSGDRDLPHQSPPRHNHPSRFLKEDEHYQKIERQFEVLHDQLQARPTSRRSHIPLSRVSSRLSSRNPRHVDLLDALFSTHRYQMQPPCNISPITPYNEDVAERNMAPFLRKRDARSQNPCTRILSALYQEDVADRNIAQSMRNRSRSRSTTRSRLRTSHSHQLDFQRQEGVRGRPRSKTKESQVMASTSQGALYSTPKSRRDKVAAPSNETAPPNGGLLRPQRSAPTLLAERNSTPQHDAPRTERHLGVPPAHKQGDSWSNTPLPDSPTLPMAMDQGKSSSGGNGNPQDSPAGSTPSPRLPNTPRDQAPLTLPRVSSGKNIRDLSINTELAARGRPGKIAHRAIQPLTPNNLDIKQNPSIEEVMNSPFLSATPTDVSPLPVPDWKVAEIMDMFRKAYASTQAITPHPTFETLQDAIIREINCHEAFQRVPVPEAGPLFTPSPSQSSFDRSVDALKHSNSISMKDGHLSKLKRKTSMKKHRRGSESRKSISTSVPSSVFRRSSETASRRRHTDAPVPSPGVFDPKDSNRHRQQASREEAITSMDLFLRSERSTTGARRTTSSLGSGSGSASTTNPSVLYMRAQASASSIGSPRTSLSADDSDEDIIQLPSVSIIPQVQIQGVDENNVTYVAGNTTPRTAYRLMNWPRKSNRGVTLQTSLVP